MENSRSEGLSRFCTALEPDGRIAAIYLFGSHARGTATALSDIDLAILLHSDLDESRFFSLRLDYITRAMQTLHTEKVDVVILNNAPLHLAYEIVSHGILLVDRNPGYRVAFEADHIGRFLDLKPFLAVQLDALREQLNRGTFFD
jgi:predicted nucleotidyltransferase